MRARDNGEGRGGRDGGGGESRGEVASYHINEWPE